MDKRLSASEELSPIIHQHQEFCPETLLGDLSPDPHYIKLALTMVHFPLGKSWIRPRLRQIPDKP